MSSLRRCARPGVARWVQVLVVLGVVVILIGLLFPAVCRVRHAAARMQCSNNLKQIAIALHTYADANGRKLPSGEDVSVLPAGTIPNPALAPEQRLSWLVEILPYVEANNLYSRLDRKVGWEAPVNEPVVRTAYKVYQCPDWGREPPLEQMNLTPYIGVAGLGSDAATLPAGHERAGVFGYDRRTALADITDGLSNTMVVLESARDNGPWAQGGPATVRGLDPDDTPYLGVGRPFGGTHFTERPWFHPRRSLGCNVAMADGSVRFLAESIDAAVLQALATIAGKEELPADW